MNTTKTYGDIYNEFLAQCPNGEAEDYRPAIPFYVPELLKGIPNAIVVWLKNGGKIIYVAAAIQ